MTTYQIPTAALRTIQRDILTGRIPASQIDRVTYFDGSVTYGYVVAQDRLYRVERGPDGQQTGPDRYIGRIFETQA